jgi:hypothetical protein
VSFEDEINEAIDDMNKWRDEMRKKRGRPIPEGGRRDYVLNIRINEEEKKQLTTLMEKFEMNSSEVVRALIDEGYAANSDEE